MGTVSDIYDPELYVAGPIHEIFAGLRRTDPVHWQEMPGEPGYWAILKHADVSHVARNPELFSAEVEGVILENQPPERLEQTRNMLLMMDPPRHTEYRKPLAEHFKARVVGDMEDRVRELTRDLLDSVDGDVEFVHDVAGVLPSQVVGGLFGIPAQDWPSLRRWAEQSVSQQDPDLVGDFDVTAELTNMAIYAIQFSMARREQEPQADLTSLILAGSFGGKAMSDLEFGSFFTQLVTAGNDTTKTMLSSGLQLLLAHPEQLAALRENPALIPGAVEEILRYANPLHYFRRTATADTEIRGVPIKAGDKVAMWYTSANRDEDVFADAESFDIRRNPNPHLSFGLAQHFCLGVHLARLEGRVFFEELLTRFPKLEQTGDARRIRSNLNNGLKSLPVRMTR
ncbi:cytochrome P450 [Nocardia tengchongensis]|uniref:Cytochrome P450 n=1 Tax=Nocardia tengchongensis TaxID=2055889 RepID=A0ABX8CLZ7_9NOCA|nr:cytochrome P450 [Nocardia tengchongensis]QVI20988.1 cytochrome P450 [Nocardia tengchongensis]